MYKRPMLKELGGNGARVLPGFVGVGVGDEAVKAGKVRVCNGVKGFGGGSFVDELGVKGLDRMRVGDGGGV